MCKKPNKTSNCPISTKCAECWNKIIEKRKKGIEYVQCPRCSEFFEMKQPLPDKFTCPYCGTTFSTNVYDSDPNEIEEIKKMLG